MGMFTKENDSICALLVADSNLDIYSSRAELKTLVGG